MAERPDERRLVAAMELTLGEPGATARTAGQRGTRRAVVVRILWILVVVAGSVAAAAHFGPKLRARGTDRQASETLENLGTVASIAGAVLVVVALIWLFASGRFRAGWHSPLLALSGRQRRDLRRQMRGRRPADPAQLPLTRQLARDAAAQQPQLLSMAGMVLLQVGSAVRGNSTFQWRIVAAVALMFVVVAVLVLRDAARARAFLATHPETEAEAVR